MANAAKMGKAVRMLLTGYPGTGKTGALASLANAGFKLRIIDFDGNPESLLEYTDADKLENIDILTFEDSMGLNGNIFGAKGLPTAFTRSAAALDHWKYTEEDGTVVDLGKSKDWGPDTILVIDGLTGQSKCAIDWATAVCNKTPLNRTQAVWGVAASSQEGVIKKLTGASNRFHVIAISHLKIIGPKEISEGDDPTNKEIKETLAAMVPTRLYPTAVGRGLPQTISGEFPIVLMAETKVNGNKVKRVLTYAPRPETTTKLPTKQDLGELRIEDGLLNVFKALGANPPKG